MIDSTPNPGLQSEFAPVDAFRRELALSRKQVCMAG